MTTITAWALALTLATLAVAPALAGELGQATGTMAVDGSTARLAYATSGASENLFDSTKKDTIVVLSDRPLEGVAPDDEVELHMRARDGKLAALVLRLDGSTLVNVAVHATKGSEMVVLPGPWFTFRGAKAGAGTLMLATREWDGHSYACTVEFSAAPARPVSAAAGAPAAPARPEPTPTLPPASTSSIEPRRWPRCSSRR